jgi:hypothetical protein
MKRIKKISYDIIHMRNNTISTPIFFLLLLIIIITGGSSFGQTKPKSRPPQKQKTPPVEHVQNNTVIKFTPEQLEGFKQQSGQMVKFFEGTLNFLADKSNPVNEKQTIITESYLKYFWDNKVQVEDDLDENRKVPLYKDIPAYLTDVAFFFKTARFENTVQDVAILTNDIGQTYFKVTANRNLKGITVNGDSVNSNRVRYFEINYDSSKQELKIVSIYTTKLNEKDDMRVWWNGLSDGWKTIFGKELKVNDTLTFNRVSEFDDSLAVVNNQKIKVDGGRIYNLILQIIKMRDIDISGNSSVSSLEPLGKLSSLMNINISNTPVSDLMPLRNLNAVEILDCSGTLITTLEPLKYAVNIKELRLKKTQIKSIAVLSGFSSLEVLDITNTPVDSLEPLRDLTGLRNLQCESSGIKDLKPLAGLVNLALLNFSGTHVSDADPLKNCKKLMRVAFDETKVNSLSAFENLPELTKIYCDSTGITSEMALQFTLKHPSILVVFESGELIKWWNAMSPEWRKVFNLYQHLSDLPTPEQLHGLLLIDSVNINGRSTINSLIPVEKLTRLRHIEFSNTTVTSIDPLHDLILLTTVNANNSRITSVAPLSTLTNLKYLYIENTPVSDLAPLKPLKYLAVIYADNSGINATMESDFRDTNPECMVIFQTYENTNWWKNLPQPYKECFLSQMHLSGTPDKIQLQQIVSAEKFIITENTSITSLVPVLKLSRLKELQFTGTAITSLEPVMQMKNLEILRFPKNPITDLTPLARKQGLKELDFSNTPVEDLEQIQFLTHLEVLKFSGTQVKNLKYIKNMTHLNTLEFYNTRVSDLDDIDQLSGLKSLKIFNTKISQKRVDKFKAVHPHCEVVYYK